MASKGLGGGGQTLSGQRPLKTLYVIARSLYWTIFFPNRKMTYQRKGTKIATKRARRQFFHDDRRNFFYLNSMTSLLFGSDCARKVNSSRSKQGEDIGSESPNLPLGDEVILDRSPFSHWIKKNQLKFYLLKTGDRNLIFSPKKYHYTLFYSTRKLKKQNLDVYKILY